MVTGVVGLCVRALACASLPAALVLGGTFWLVHQFLHPDCSIHCPIHLVSTMMNMFIASYWEELGLQASH